MSHGHGSHAEIRNPGSYQTPSGMKFLFWAFILIGAGSFALQFSADKQQAWATFVQNHFYFLSLAVGGLFFAAIQWVTGAMWSAPVRRIGEAFTSYLPFVILTMGVLFLGLHDLYHWTHADAVRTDTILAGKVGYLNTTFFIIRNIFAVLVWIFFAWKMIGNSIKQDQDGDYKHTLKNRFWGPAFLMLFALTYTTTAFDQLMSLDPHWFSTIFGIYCFAGLFYSTLALTCIITIHLRRNKMLDGIVNDNHLHDLGKFMFAFTVFWAYIGFSQFMLIWYANLPEEISFYLKRMDGGWMWVSAFLLFGKFLVPFFLLMPRDAKRNENVLLVAAWFMLIAQWIDVLWLVQPEFFSAGPRVGLYDIGMTAGFVGVFGLLVFRFLSKNNIVAIKDPRLIESVHHHHQ